MATAEAIKFMNEAVRPVAEQLRALAAELDSLDVRWAAIQAQFPDTTDVMDDGREAEGVSRLSGRDVRDLMYAVGLVKGTLASIAAATLEKPCVRPLRAE